MCSSPSCHANNIYSLDSGKLAEVKLYMSTSCQPFLIKSDISKWVGPQVLTTLVTAGLEKLTNASRSINTVNDRLFPVELTEIADWTSMSQYMLHSNFGQTLTRVISGNFGAYTLILPLCQFPKYLSTFLELGRIAQSVGHLTCKSGVLGSIPGLATYFRFFFRFFMKGSCQLLAKVCARRTG